MKLSRLLAPLNLPCPPEDPEITGLTCDSRRVEPGMLFAALPGARRDGQDFLPQALARGAAALLTHGEADAPVPTVTVPDPRETLALLAGEFYGHPARELTLLAVTGTKGKTTVAHMLRAILTAAGHKTGMMGTLGAFSGERLLEETGNTTPEPVALHRLLRDMADGGCTHAVLEVSSQAMKLHRVEGIRFDAAVFLNLSPDHIGPGEHADLTEYRACKAALFRQCALAAGNADDPAWPAVAREIPAGVPAVTFGFGPQARIRGVKLKPDSARPLASRLWVAGCREPWPVPLPGRFNAENALAAIALARALGVADAHIRAGLAAASVPGRCQLVPMGDGVNALIDYAHNGQSVRALLRALRPHVGGRIIAVLGAGGDRPPMRRRDMALAAAQGADYAVFTEDNPRSERAEDICAQMAAALDGAIPHTIVPDRREAIRFALAMARPGDLVALLGKGHEAYIEAGGLRRPFSERAVLEEWRQEHISS